MIANSFISINFLCRFNYREFNFFKFYLEKNELAYQNKYINFINIFTKIKNINTKWLKTEESI